MSMPAESLTCTRSKGLSSLSSPSLSRSRGNRHSTRTRERRRSQQQLWSVFAAALPHSSSDTVERITEIPAKVSSGQEQGRCSTVRGSKICDYLPSTSGRSTGKHSRHKPPRKLAVANVKNFCDREDDREQRDQAQELISSVIPSYGKGCNSFLQSLPRTELRRDASPSASSTASSGVCSTESCRNSIVSDSVLSSAKERSLRHFSVPVTDSGESSESSINESDQPAVLPGLKSSCPFEVPYSPEQLWYIHEWYVARCSAVDSSSQCRQKLCRNRRSRQRQQGKHAVNSTRGMWMSQQRNAESYNKFMGIYGSYNRGITPAITTSPNIFLLTASGYENYFPVDGIQTSLATETTCYFPRPATAVSGISPSSSYSVSSSPCTDTVRDVKPVVITHIEPSSEITPNEKELEKLASRPAYGASHALNVHSVSADDKGIYTTLTVGNSTALVRVGGVSADEPSPPQVLQLTSDSRIGPSLLGVSIPKGHPQSCASTFSVPHSSENRMGRIAVSEQSQQQLPSTSYSRRHPKVYLNLKKCASPLSTSADSCTSNADVMTGSSAMEDRFDTAPVSSLSAKNSDDVVPKPRPLPPANPSRKRLIDGDKENFATPSPECQCRELSFESDDEIGLIDDITESNHDVLQNKAKEFHGLLPTGESDHYLSMSPKAPSALLTETGSFEVSKMDVLSEEIWHYHNKVIQSEGVLTRKLHLRDMLYLSICPIFPMSGLYVVGSSLNGFGNNSSDMDLCLMITNKDLDQRTDAVVVLNMIQAALSGREWIRDQQLIIAKVPILRLKFTEPFEDITVDLNANNSVAIRNTHLLCYYSVFDWRVRPLVSVVKEWAKKRDINDANRSSFTSYSLVLMVIHYLQCGVKPRILPSLQEMYPKRFHQRADVRTLSVSLPLKPPPRSEWEFNETTTLGELLIGFLEYYAFKFDYLHDAISVRLGKKIERAVVARQRSPYNSNNITQWNCICIEEPFTFSNTAHSVHNQMVFDAIKQAFVDGFRELDANRDLRAFLDAPPIDVMLSHSWSSGTQLFALGSNHSLVHDDQLSFVSRETKHSSNTSLKTELGVTKSVASESGCDVTEDSHSLTTNSTPITSCASSGRSSPVGLKLLHGTPDSELAFCDENVASVIGPPVSRSINSESESDVSEWKAAKTDRDVQALVTFASVVVRQCPNRKGTLSSRCAPNETSTSPNRQIFREKITTDIMTNMKQNNSKCYYVHSECGKRNSIPQCHKIAEASRENNGPCDGGSIGSSTGVKT